MKPSELIQRLHVQEIELRRMLRESFINTDESVHASLAGAAELVRRARSLISCRIDLQDIEDRSNS